MDNPFHPQPQDSYSSGQSPYMQGQNPYMQGQSPYLAKENQASLQQPQPMMQPQTMAQPQTQVQQPQNMVQQQPQSQPTAQAPQEFNPYRLDPNDQAPAQSPNIDRGSQNPYAQEMLLKDTRSQETIEAQAAMRRQFAAEEAQRMQRAGTERPRDGKEKKRNKTMAMVVLFSIVAFLGITLMGTFAMMQAVIPALSGMSDYKTEASNVRTLVVSTDSDEGDYSGEYERTYHYYVVFDVDGQSYEGYFSIKDGRTYDRDEEDASGAADYDITIKCNEEDMSQACVSGTVKEGISTYTTIDYMDITPIE